MFSFTRALPLLATALLPTLVHGQASLPVVYVLDAKSAWQQGCFPPCKCPLGPETPVTGTFRLVFEGFSDWYDRYAVTDVDWTVETAEGKVLHITGSGSYIVGGDFVLDQRLILDLSTNGSASERFDSGMVIGGGLPRIDITVSINQLYCYDTVIQVIAAPQAVPPVLYRLGPRSTYQEGCFGMCNCVLYPESRITGTFLLTLEDSNPLFQTYAFAEVDWHSFAGTQSRHLTGKGLYRIGGEVALTQQLELDLAINGDGPEHFDSGMVPGGAKFPLIDIQVTIGQLVCFDRPIHVIGAPVVDFNLDGRSDRADLEWFLSCVSGPEIGLGSFGCAAADLDADRDVDQSDFGLLQRCWPEAGDLVDPACLE
ncbi:MAG: hypothetical protein KA354_07845 [Phycisphaerae bacterium]|nr:hypothetical protein [Phycisphaerae bacterium]